MTAVEDASSNLRSGSFRPRARLLQLLGDQLIGSPRLALFELVKNAYDADAEVVTVTMEHLEERSKSLIKIRDDGSGMSFDTLTNIWLVPGHDHKAKMRARNERTPKGRLPLGEKGVGRFAVHKLGNEVEVVTRVSGEDECIIRIDWDELAESEFLDQVSIDVRRRSAITFPGTQHGTEITVRKLRGSLWTRGEVRRLSRQVTSISSPFEFGDRDFRAEVYVPQNKGWLDDMPDTKALLEAAPWSFAFTLENNSFSWEYEFRGVPGAAVEPRRAAGTSFGMLLNPEDLDEEDRTGAAGGSKRGKAVLSDLAMVQGIGPISGKLYVYDRDKEVLQRVGYSQVLQSFLDESGGIRVYRDGIRVYNYGEPGDDWLGMDVRRINAPSRRISNNIVIGAVELDL